MSLPTERRVQIEADRLADWLVGLPSTWWSVDGDPLLTGRVGFPCPAAELAAELRRIRKPLLVLAPEPENGGPSCGSEAIEQLCVKDEHGNWVFQMRWADQQPDMVWIMAEDMESEQIYTNSQTLEL